MPEVAAREQRRGRRPSSGVRRIDSVLFRGTRAAAGSEQAKRLGEPAVRIDQMLAPYSETARSKLSSASGTSSALARRAGSGVELVLKRLALASCS